MNGATLKRATSKPAMPPDVAPNASAATIASGKPIPRGSPALSVAVATMPESATTDPTDRSIPAVKMTNVMPAAMIAVIDACSDTFRRLSAVKK